MIEVELCGGWLALIKKSEIAAVYETNGAAAGDCAIILNNGEELVLYTKYTKVKRELLK